MASVPLNAFSLQAEDRFFQFPFPAPGEQTAIARVLDAVDLAVHGIAASVGAATP